MEGNVVPSGHCEPGPCGLCASASVVSAECLFVAHLFIHSFIHSLTMSCHGAEGLENSMQLSLRPARLCCVGSQAPAAPEVRGFLPPGLCQ